MKRILILCIALISFGSVSAQTFRHYDFLGAGHDNEVKVQVSSSVRVNGQATVDGFSIKNEEQLKDASRFLAQATFGADFATIEMTAAMGYDSWLTEQFELPQVSILEKMRQQNQTYPDEEYEVGDPVFNEFFRISWMTNNLTLPDLLRQRMAFNLSQLMVINDNSDFFEDVGDIIGHYYDLLSTHSFSNYQQLLTQVTLSPAMGNFLSHYNNPKADPANNIHPDENYAREIMQLFSIGLWELHPDGTRKTDHQGQFIPTYTNADIKEFAQVFTGLGNGTPGGEFGLPADDNGYENVAVVTTPMKMYESFHDRSEKRLLNGVVLPADQSGMEDINQTILHLCNHANTAPFISKSLIKMMTTSNPSPRYVQDVAAAFDPTVSDNFQTVIRSILLHPEARSCERSEQYTFGKLREPVVRMLNFLRAFPMTVNEYGDFYYAMECFGTNTGQSPLDAPSVFNFFLPDYQPPGPIGQNYLVGPEFQILNATNAIGVVNDANFRAVKRGYLMEECSDEGEEEEEEEPDPEESEEAEEEDYELYSEHIMDYSAEEMLVNNPSALVDRLDILLANGLLTSNTKSIIINALDQLNDPKDRIKMAIYLILISPDYAILK